MRAKFGQGGVAENDVRRLASQLRPLKTATAAMPQIGRDRLLPTMFHPHAIVSPSPIFGFCLTGCTSCTFCSPFITFQDARLSLSTGNSSSDFISTPWPIS